MKRIFLGQYRILLSCLAIFAFAELILLVSISTPAKEYFDEVHYVRASRQILAFVPNKNIEHPPLGKVLIGAGILLFGDSPFGWRVMSAVFGGLTLVGMYLLGLAVLREEKAGWIAMLAMFLSQMFYVESRLAVIDPFMLGFLVFALAFYSFALGGRWNRVWSRVSLALSGICFGLAMACKWSAIPIYVFCLYLAAYRSRRNKGKTVLVLLALLVLPLLSYFLSFTPYFLVDAPGYRPADFIIMQTNIWVAQMLTPGSNPYRSLWFEWPFNLKPYWYIFDPDQKLKVVRGILLLGNPLILFGGLVAVGVCGYQWLRTRSESAFFIFASYLVLLLLPWSILPREASYFYYYYPATIALSLALAYAFTQANLFSSARGNRILAIYLIFAFAVFAICFPVLSYSEVRMDLFRSYLAGWLPPIYVWPVDIVH
jgi:predicted membrane-bound dolichyl-phosphate-mannose-protein mannosyltransferase